MTDLLAQAACRADKYLKSLAERSVWPSPAALEALQAFDEPLRDEPTNPEEVLEMLDRVGSPATVSCAGPRFFGFVHGGTLPVTLAANWLAGAWDQNAVLHITSPLAARLEDVSAGWLTEVLDLPADCGIGFVTGATTASFTALAAARTALLERQGWDVEANGLYGAPPLQVVVSEETHPSVLKGLALLGLGRERVTRVPTDGQGRMRPDALPPLGPGSVVCIQAGNVNTGSVDPADEVCARAREAGAWVHVDGAFGLWAKASPRLAALTAGVELADSWATDAHKWLNVPYDSGLAFVRDAKVLNRAMAMSAAYILAGTRRDPGMYTPELSRRARGIEIWAALRALGRRGLAEMIERTCDHARRFAEGLRAAGAEVLNDVVLNQVLVAFGDAETTRRTVARIQEGGVCWCGGTNWKGREAMRISISNWSTREEDVDQSLEAMLRAWHG